jgi:hypothetical protein
VRGSPTPLTPRLLKFAVAISVAISVAIHNTRWSPTESCEVLSLAAGAGTAYIRKGRHRPRRMAIGVRRGSHDEGGQEFPPPSRRCGERLRVLRGTFRGLSVTAPGTSSSRNVRSRPRVGPSGRPSSA